MLDADVCPNLTTSAVHNEGCWAERNGCTISITSKRSSRKVLLTWTLQRWSWLTILCLAGHIASRWLCSTRTAYTYAATQQRTGRSGWQRCLRVRVTQQNSYNPRGDRETARMGRPGTISVILQLGSSLAYWQWYSCCVDIYSTA